jgi:hypothetical protein
MGLFSALLPVNESPFSNKVLNQDERLSLNPAENPGRHIRPPEPLITRSKDQYWTSEAVDNCNDLKRGNHAFYRTTAQVPAC